MWKHAAILSAAVLSAIGAAQAVRQLHPAQAQAAVSAPARTSVTTAGPSSTAEVSKAADGHYWAEATVQGRHVRFLVDTGASAVALTATDAQRLGLDLKSMSFDRTVSTAAGATRAALVELDYVSVAGARVDKVPALVLEKGLETSLLGMSYLGRLSKFEATPHALILRP